MMKSWLNPIPRIAVSERLAQSKRRNLTLRNIARRTSFPDVLRTANDPCRREPLSFARREEKGRSALRQS